MKLYVFIAICLVQCHKLLAGPIDSQKLPTGPVDGQKFTILKTIHENSAERQELASEKLVTIVTETEIGTRTDVEDDKLSKVTLIPKIPQDSNERHELSLAKKPEPIDIETRIGTGIDHKEPEKEIHEPEQEVHEPEKDINEPEIEIHEQTEEEKRRLKEESIALRYFPNFKQANQEIMLDFWLQLGTKKSLTNAYKYFEENYDELLAPYTVNAKKLARYAKILILYAKKAYNKVDEQYRHLCERAYNVSLDALETYNWNGQAHLWYAVSLYSLIEIKAPLSIELESAHKKIEEHFHKANAEFNVIDPYLYHFRGLWKVFSKQPMDSACLDFYKADELKLDWEENMFYEKNCKPREELDVSSIPADPPLVTYLFNQAVERIDYQYHKKRDTEEILYGEAFRAIDLLVRIETNKTIQAALDILEESYDEEALTVATSDMLRRFSVVTFLKAVHMFNNPENKEYKLLCLKAKDFAAKALSMNLNDEHARLWYAVTLQAASEFDQSAELKLELQSLEDHFTAANNVGGENAYFQFAKAKWFFQKPVAEWRFPSCFHIEKVYKLKPELIEGTIYQKECQGFLDHGMP